MIEDGQKQLQLIKKIKKLIALSNSPNENEATAAALKVEQLLVEYNLTLTKVQQTDTSDFVTSVFEKNGRSLYRWKSELATQVANAYFCSHLFISNRKTSSQLFVGKEHNVVVATEMYNYLKEVIERSSYNYSDKKNSRNTFAMGMVQSISRRLWEKRQQHTREQNKALIVIKNAIDIYTDEKHKPRAYKCTYVCAYEKDDALAGREAGEAVGLDDQLQHKQTVMELTERETK